MKQDELPQAPEPQPEEKSVTTTVTTTTETKPATTTTTITKVLFIDDTAMFVEIAESLEIRSIHHEDCSSKSASLASFGLRNYEGAIDENMGLRR